MPHSSGPSWDSWSLEIHSLVEYYLGIYEYQILNTNYILLVAVLELLGAGTTHCGGSSIGTAVEVEVEEDVVAVEVEVDGAKRTLLTKFI